MQSELELLIRCGFPDLAEDPDQERRVAATGARLCRAAKAAVGDDADERAATVLALRNRLRADHQAAEVFVAAIELPDAEFVEALLETIRRWSHLARVDPDFATTAANWVSFKEPEKTNFNALVPHEIETRDGYAVWKGRAVSRRRRDGFALTDKRCDARHILYEIDHCIYCHDRDADSCSKGMRNRKDGSYKVNPLGVNITGCPLEEKISEMHLVKRQGDNIGALALIVIDNPMCPGTGHRICNDCMKGCIYQKTQPVDIPQIETSVLTDVLFMPYGFEIYSLLTRWNPLNVRRPYALPYHGTNALVVGLGPAGYTLAHYLLNEGFGVVGIDALKIEPLPADLLGDGEHAPKPIKDFQELYDDLDKRMLAGFGGVAEYGITVRWDKNFLKVIYLNLVRRASFRCYGGVRFGGTLGDRGRLGARVRPHRGRDGCWQADDHRPQEQSDSRYPQGVGFSDGVAVDRRRESIVASQFAGTPSGWRRRWRFDRSRYGDGAHGLLSDSSRKTADSLRAALRGRYGSGRARGFR